MTTLADAFFTNSWTYFEPDAATMAWARAALPVSERLLASPALRTQWLRCGGTWFAGVNVFPNDASGGIPEEGVPPLAGAAVDFVNCALGLSGFAWDPAQISICFPGYPKPWEGESDAASRFRRDRDAAHVDGLLRDAARRRHLGETHDFILGLPLSDVPETAAPLVVWEGSHEVMRAAFRERFAGVDPVDWAVEDVTDAYAAARRRCFDTLPRHAVHVRPGAAYLVHRLALHGVAPWGEGAGQVPRSIAYFRPNTDPSRSPDWWLESP